MGGMTDADYVAAFQKIVMPIAYEFRPDFVLGKRNISPVCDLG